MYIDDKLIEWVTATDDIHADFVKKNFYNEILLANPKTEKKNLDSQINIIKEIVKTFSNKPWTTQKEISEKFELNKNQLLKINELISETDLLQDLILKKVMQKAWNSIIPFSYLTEKAIKMNIVFQRELLYFLEFHVCFIVLLWSKSKS